MPPRPAEALDELIRAMGTKLDLRLSYYEKVYISIVNIAEIFQQFSLNPIGQYYSHTL